MSVFGQNQPRQRDYGFGRGLQIGSQTFRRFIFVDYNRFCSSPKSQTKRIYDFFELPHYEHNFEKIYQAAENSPTDTHEFLAKLNFKYLNQIKDEFKKKYCPGCFDTPGSYL